VQTKAVVPPRDEAPAAAPPKKEKVAALAPAATNPQPTGAGYVAVLASVPASGSSRMDALKQFADMQQKYGSILSNKTPDIQEANLGEKGTYHRLMVGPPGSRDSASSVCTQLKAEGYSGCWVTAY
jgi:cell division septation protein DedD